MQYLAVILAGLVAGSFLNVCIYRLPRGESIIFPPSHCPHCEGQLGPGDLVPVVSFFLLWGKCRQCHAAISWRYPLIELFTGVAFLLVYIRLGGQPGFVGGLVLAGVLIVATFTDLEHYIIPNALVLFSLVAGLLANLIFHVMPWSQVFWGFMAGGLPLYLVALLSRGGMGGGDIKLAAVAGIFLGWQGILTALFLAVIAAGLVGGILLLVKKKGRKDPIPFGPFIALGSLVSLLWGAEVLDWYFALFNITT
ncbi:MAG: prepilin peptidase [Bacillota bacterium]